MKALMVLGIPLFLLFVWAIVFDLKQRRLGRGTHDIAAAGSRTRADVDSKGGDFPRGADGFGGGADF